MTSHDGTIAFADLLAVLGGPDAVSRARQGVVRSLFLKHTGGAEFCNFDAFSALLEELSPAATVRENLWAAARRFRRAQAEGRAADAVAGVGGGGGGGSSARNGRLGSARSGSTPNLTAPRGAADKGFDGDQNKVIATLRAKIKSLEDQASMAKSAAKLEHEVQGMRRQNAALKRESSASLAKVSETKEKAEVEIKKAQGKAQKLLSMLLAGKDREIATLEASKVGKEKECAQLQEKLQTSERLREQSKAEVAQLKKQLAEQQSSAAAALADNMKLLQTLRQDLLVGDEPPARAAPAAQAEPMPAPQTPTPPAVAAAEEGTMPFAPQQTAALEKATVPLPKPAPPPEPGSVAPDVAAAAEQQTPTATKQAWQAAGDHETEVEAEVSAMVARAVARASASACAAN